MRRASGPRRVLAIGGFAMHDMELEGGGYRDGDVDTNFSANRASQHADRCALFAPRGAERDRAPRPPARVSAAACSPPATAIMPSPLPTDGTVNAGQNGTTTPAASSRWTARPRRAPSARCAGTQVFGPDRHADQRRHHQRQRSSPRRSPPPRRSSSASPPPTAAARRCDRRHHRHGRPGGSSSFTAVPRT